MEVTSAPVPGAPDCRWVTAVAPADGGGAVRATISDSGDELAYERTVELRVSRGGAAAVHGTVGFGGLSPNMVGSERPRAPLETTLELDGSDFPLREGGIRADRDLTGHYLVRFLDQDGRVVSARGGLLSP